MAASAEGGCIGARGERLVAEPLEAWIEFRKEADTSGRCRSCLEFAEEEPKPVVTVVTPDGYRIEGVERDDVGRMLESLR